MTTAFVLWGAGSLGAAQVGMLRALAGAGVRADLVVGASVGALNGVYYAARPDPDGVEELAGLWGDIGEHDVFPLYLSDSLRVFLEHLPWSPVRGLLRAMGLTNYVFPLDPITLLSAATGRANHLTSSGRFREFLHRVLPVQRLDQTEIPLEVLTADLHTGEAVPIAKGPAARALLASTALPGMHPPVEIDGRMLIDGAMAAQTTLDRAIQLGADEIYLLTPGFSPTPSDMFAMAVHVPNMLAEHRMNESIAAVPPNVRIHQLPTLRPAGVFPVDFTHATELIEHAAESTTDWLARA